MKPVASRRRGVRIVIAGGDLQYSYHRPACQVNGAVKAASADSVVVAGKEKNKEVEWTFAVDPNTSIRRDGKSITPAGLKPGDSVHVRYMDMGGKAVAQSITVKGGGMVKKEAKTEKK